MSTETVGFAGEPITVWVRPGYLGDALGCMAAPQTTLSFGSHPGRAFLMRPVGTDGAPGEYRHVVMPVQPPPAVRAA